MTDRKNNPRDAENWFASPDDVNEFENHYSGNKDTWDKAFAWLNNVNLQSIAPGKYEIDGDKVYASVAEYVPKELKDTRFEAHRKYIDIQYVVKGVETIGVAPLSKGMVITSFDAERDIGFFEIPEADCKYYTVEPGKIFIFFPKDAHRPGIRSNDGEVRKLVVKIRL